MRQDISTTRAVGLALDAVLFDTQPADAVRPAGLRNRIVALTSSANLDGRGAMVADLAALADAVSPIGGPIAYVAAPGRAATINLWATRELPYPVLSSTAIAPADLLCVATNGLASALDTAPRIGVSRYATVTRARG